jgi:S-DNA-T family DNA segregation ATPase FtsK/SpoIIIE
MQFRGLVPTRICLRVKEAMHVTMVLGEGSRARGARADRIPKGLPGVGYAETDDDATPRRFRAPFVTDDDLTALARDYAPAV